VRWNVDTPENGSLNEGVEIWKDPGAGSNKQSLVDFTAKGGRPLASSSALTCQTTFPILSKRDVGGQPDEADVPQPGILNSTSCLEGVANSEAEGKAMSAGATAHSQGHLHGDVGLISEPDVESGERRRARRDTVMINAAFMGPRSAGPKTFNKPIVIDIDLPVWRFEKHAE
jgi:hypothetical protein